MIELRNFQCRYPDRSRATLQGVNLHVGDGEKVLLTGRSGSGKSTLLRVLAGLEEDAECEGSCRVDGPVGLVLQDPDSQVIASRVGDDVAFGCENLGVPRQEIWPRVEAALAQVGLDLLLDCPTSKLSGGQKQRLALAGVLAMGARVVLLDEPTANLDALGCREVMEAVTALDTTVIIVDHRPWPVDRVLLLEEGTLEPGEFPSRPQLPPAHDVQSQPLVKAEELRTRWGAPHTFHLPEGASSVICGPNGAGKTTLLLTLAGLLPPESGRLLFKRCLLPERLVRGGQGDRRQVRQRRALTRGTQPLIGQAETESRFGDCVPVDPFTWSSRDLASRIGFVFQDPEHQFVARSVRAELEAGFSSHTHGWGRGVQSPSTMTPDQQTARIDELLERLHLRHLEHANPFTLSGGEKRRLSVATALVSAPQLVLLDEPTFGQDPETFGQLVGLLRELTDAGVTLVSVTHDEDFVGTLGDHRIEVKLP